MVGFLIVPVAVCVVHVERIFVLLPVRFTISFACCPEIVLSVCSEPVTSAGESNLNNENTHSDTHTIGIAKTSMSLSFGFIVYYIQKLLKSQKTRA